MSFEELDSQAGKIHQAIIAASLCGPVRITVNRYRTSEAVAKLRRGLYRKPFLWSSKKWLRSLLIQDNTAFRFLAGHIELESAWNGRLYRWTGYGTKVYPHDDLPPQMRDLIQSKLGPFYITIQLGTDISGFSGLLDDV